MVSKSIIIIVGIIVLITIAGFVLLGSGRDTSTTSSVPVKTTNAPRPTTTTAPKTDAPVITQQPTKTSAPVEEYVNAASGGTFKTGDKVSYLGVKGEITTGEIVNGKPTTYTVIRNEQDQILLEYRIRNHPTYGHLELISKPQKGEVVMKQGGKDIALMKYEDWADFETYRIIACQPELFPEDTKNLLMTRYDSCK